MVGAEIIEKYFPELSQPLREKFRQLQIIYAAENEKVNLISRKDFENIYTNHVLHSLALAKFCSFPQGCEVVDIGTGGGFPGISLAMMFPQTQFVLCDSIGKKIRAVGTMIEALDLNNAKCVNSRAEQLPGKFDIAMARAVAPMKELWGWMQNHWKNKPVFYLLKGGDLSEEMNDLLEINPRIQIKQFHISEVFDEPFFETKKVVQLTLS